MEGKEVDENVVDGWDLYSRREEMMCTESTKSSHSRTSVNLSRKIDI